jgi:transcription elongation factor Elf1
LSEVRIFLTAEDAYLGRNGNYGDSSGSSYSWDTTVGNHALPNVGDIVILRSKQRVLGVSILTDVDKRSSWKTRLRCPNCLSTKLKWSSRRETFRCGPCSKMTASPNAEFLTGIDSYHARYDWFFTPIEDVSLGALREVSKTPNGQQSIQSAYLGPALELLPTEALWRMGFSRLAGQFLRKDRVAIGRRSATSIAKTGGTCGISGIHSSNRLVRFDYLVFSTKDSRVLIEGSCAVLDILAAQLELGHCVVEDAKNSIIVPSLQGLPRISFPMKPENQELKKWLSLFSGQLDD